MISLVVMSRTEFNDRSGKSIYTGDIVQWRLGKFGKKSGGPVLYRVVQTKKGVKIVTAHDPHSIGRLMRKHDEEFITIVDTSAREVEAD